MTRTFDDVLDQCLAELLAGNADIDALVSRFPAEAAALRPLLETAVQLRSDGVEPYPESAWVEDGWRRLAAAIRDRKNAPDSIRDRIAALAGWLLPRNWSGRARAAVVVGAVGLVGASGFAAAAGGMPDVAPFRFFASSSSSVTPVPEIEFEGAIVAVEGNVLTVDANGAHERVVLDARTEIKDPANEKGNVALVIPGVRVKVEGVRQPDGSVLARELKLLPAGATATPTRNPEPGPARTPAAFGGDCDPSGPGNPCKEEDRSGPGPNAGPGNAENREVEDVGEAGDDDIERQATPTRTPRPDDDDAPDDGDAEDRSGSGGRGRGSSGEASSEESSGSGSGERDDREDDHPGESRRDDHGRGDEPDA